MHETLTMFQRLSLVRITTLQQASLSPLSSRRGLTCEPVFLPCRYVCRWIKFEEKVEKGGERWSKPHVATLSLHSLFELRTCIEKGTIMLDMEASTLPQVVGTLSAPPRSSLASSHLLPARDTKHQLRFHLLRRVQYLQIIRREMQTFPPVLLS